MESIQSVTSDLSIIRSPLPVEDKPILIPSPSKNQEINPKPFDVPSAPKLVIGGIPFTNTSFDQAVQWVLTTPGPGQATSVRLANAFCVAHAQDDETYRRLLVDEGVNLPDGTPVHWLMKKMSKLEGPMPERVRGPSFFNASLLASRKTTHHYFLGGTPDSLTKLRSQITKQFPGIHIAGMHSPPFAPITETLVEDWADRILSSGSNLVWVGLGSPKQDFATTMLAHRVNQHCVGVGAAFDFMAGTRREAPVWTQRLALEWAYRLATEPKRLWRRYLVGNAKFVQVVISKSTR